MRQLTVLFILTCLVATFGVSSSCSAGKINLDGKKVLIFGDSITEVGTWVSFVEYYLQKQYPSQKFDIVSVGLSSETVSGLTEEFHPFPKPCLHERLSRALEMVKPDVVIACYGMNDGISKPQSPERMKAYHNGIYKLIDVARAVKATVILMTPPVFDPLPRADKLVKDGSPDTAYNYLRPYYYYDRVLTDYSKWIMRIKRRGVAKVDVHTPMSDYLAKRRVDDPKFILAPDGCHPIDLGHLIMANQVLKVLGVRVNDSDLEKELAQVKADPMFLLVDRYRQTRSKGWLPYIGYTRGNTFKIDSIAETEKTAADLQQQIDLLRK